MSSLLKAALPVAGIGGMGAGGYYLLSDSSTIRDKLKEELKGSPRRILDSKTRAEWVEWKLVYKDSSSKISEVSSEEDLPKWCVDTLSHKFDQSKYDKAKEWCVINTSTLRGEAILKGVNLISETGNDVASKFQEAWDKLNKDKGKPEAISDATVVGDSITQKTEGGPKLQTWCTSRYSWAMYKLEAITDLSKVMKWCSEEAGTASPSK
ncbi:hypothetical protein MHF_1379 [Mycoplasma haemofelis Ohio2]|uniref:Uncharacterized protein n=1 Tax=Mycoplasma haemofelis (strain Ohio2) TaxID=859194 RepID=F6FGH7_MYCHI|nr:hypothetical protein MHF_1379 [Mycoplasma haemofelis Ohio2]